MTLIFELDERLLSGLLPELPHESSLYGCWCSLQWFPEDWNCWVSALFHRRGWILLILCLVWQGKNWCILVSNITVIARGYSHERTMTKTDVECSVDYSQFWCEQLYIWMSVQKVNKMRTRTKINVVTAKMLRTNSMALYHLCINEGLTTWAYGKNQAALNNNKLMHLQSSIDDENYLQNRKTLNFSDKAIPQRTSLLMIVSELQEVR